MSKTSEEISKPVQNGHSTVTINERTGNDVILMIQLPDKIEDRNIYWTRNNQRSFTTERYKPYNSRKKSSLMIRQLTLDDSGHYCAESEDSYGTSLLASINLNVDKQLSEVPTFLKRLHDVSAKIGARSRFLVEIDGLVPFKVTWYRDNQLLRENERFTFLDKNKYYCLDIAWTTLQDEGHWTCIAENKYGCSVSSAYLTILVPKAYRPPQFVEDLKVILSEDGAVSLECKVIGVPTPSLLWYKDGKKIKAGDTFALRADSNDVSSLGTYSCVAKNCLGQAFSSSSVHIQKDHVSTDNSVFPLGPRPKFIRQLQNAEAHIEASLTLSCQVVVPPWPKTIDWYNKNGKITEDSRYQLLADGLGMYGLEIKSVELVDDGEWKCVATSFFGIKAYTSCYVTVKFPKTFKTPKFLENLQAVMTPEGLVSFECKVIGYPTPQLRWLKDGKELRPGDVYQLTGTNSLGTYCCIARNCMGEIKSTTVLTLEDIQGQLTEEERLLIFATNQPPYFIKGLKSFEARINEEQEFSVQVSAKPDANVLWYRDNEPIEQSERITKRKESHGVFVLHFKRFEMQDQAEWKCVAINDYGQSVTSCFIKLSIPKHFKAPRFLEELKASFTQEGTVNLECKVIGVPQPELKWYKDGKHLKSGELHKIISGGNGRCCLGTYACTATNCMATARSSASLLAFEESKQPNGIQRLNEIDLLSIITEERTSQMNEVGSDRSGTYEEAVGPSFSFDGKEVSISLYETPDLTDEEALQIVEMYAEELTEHISDQNIVELPSLRFIKETITSGNILMEATIIDLPINEYPCEEELKTDADVENSLMDDSAQAASAVQSETLPHQRKEFSPVSENSQSGEKSGKSIITLEKKEINDEDDVISDFSELENKSCTNKYSLLIKNSFEDDTLNESSITETATSDFGPKDQPDEKIEPVQVSDLDAKPHSKKPSTLYKNRSFDSEDDSLHEFEKLKNKRKVNDSIQSLTEKKLKVKDISLLPQKLSQTQEESLKKEDVKISFLTKGNLSIVDSVASLVINIENEVNIMQHHLTSFNQKDASTLQLLQSILKPVLKIKNEVQLTKSRVMSNPSYQIIKLAPVLSSSLAELNNLIIEMKKFSQSIDDLSLQRTSQALLNVITKPIDNLNEQINLLNEDQWQHLQLKKLEINAAQMIKELKNYSTALQNLQSTIESSNSLPKSAIDTIKQMESVQKLAINLYKKTDSSTSATDLIKLHQSVIQYLEMNIKTFRKLQSSELQLYLDSSSLFKAEIDNVITVTHNTLPLTSLNYLSTALETYSANSETMLKKLAFSSTCLRYLDDSVEIILNSINTIEKCSEVEKLYQKKRILMTLCNLKTPLQDFLIQIHNISSEEEIDGAQVYKLINSVSIPLQLLRKEIGLFFHQSYSGHVLDLVTPSLKNLQDEISSFHNIIILKEPTDIDMDKFLIILNKLNSPFCELANKIMQAEDLVLQESPMVADPKLGIKIVLQSVSSLVDILTDLHNSNHSTSLILSNLTNPLIEVRNSLKTINDKFYEEDLEKVNITMLKTLSSPFNLLQKQLIDVSPVLTGDLKNTIKDLQRTILTIQDQVSFEYGDEPASIEYNIMTLQTLLNPINILRNHCTALMSEDETAELLRQWDEHMKIVNQIENILISMDTRNAQSILEMIRNYRSIIKIEGNDCFEILKQLDNQCIKIYNMNDFHELKPYILRIKDNFERIIETKAKNVIERLLSSNEDFDNILHVLTTYKEEDNVKCFIALLQSLNIIRTLQDSVKDTQTSSNTDSVQTPMLHSFLHTCEKLEGKISDLLYIVENSSTRIPEFYTRTIDAFSTLNNQLVHLNKCLIDQSVSDDDQKEIPFESSIRSFNCLLAVVNSEENAVMAPIKAIIYDAINELVKLQNDILFNMSLIQSEDEVSLNESEFEETSLKPNLVSVCLESMKKEVFKCDEQFAKMMKLQNPQTAITGITSSLESISNIVHFIREHASFNSDIDVQNLNRRLEKILEQANLLENLSKANVCTDIMVPQLSQLNQSFSSFKKLVDETDILGKHFDSNKANIEQKFSDLLELDYNSPQSPINFTDDSLQSDNSSLTEISNITTVIYDDEEYNKDTTQSNSPSSDLITAIQRDMLSYESPKDGLSQAESFTEKSYATLHENSEYSNAKMLKITTDDHIVDNLTAPFSLETPVTQFSELTQTTDELFVNREQQFRNAVISKPESLVFVGVGERETVIPNVQEVTNRKAEACEDLSQKSQDFAIITEKNSIEANVDKLKIDDISLLIESTDGEKIQKELKSSETTEICEEAIFELISNQSKIPVENANAAAVVTTKSKGDQFEKSLPPNLEEAINQSQETALIGELSEANIIKRGTLSSSLESIQLADFAETLLDEKNDLLPNINDETVIMGNDTTPHESNSFDAAKSGKTVISELAPLANISETFDIARSTSPEEIIKDDTVISSTNEICIQRSGEAHVLIERDTLAEKNIETKTNQESQEIPRGNVGEKKSQIVLEINNTPQNAGLENLEDFLNKLKFTEILSSAESTVKLENFDSLILSEKECEIIEIPECNMKERQKSIISTPPEKTIKSKEISESKEDTREIMCSAEISQFSESQIIMAELQSQYNEVVKQTIVEAEHLLEEVQKNTTEIIFATNDNAGLAADQQVTKEELIHTPQISESFSANEAMEPKSQKSNEFLAAIDSNAGAVQKREIATEVIARCFGKLEKLDDKSTMVSKEMEEDTKIEQFGKCHSQISEAQINTVEYHTEHVQKAHALIEKTDESKMASLSQETKNDLKIETDVEILKQNFEVHSSVTEVSPLTTVEIKSQNDQQILKIELQEVEEELPNLSADCTENVLEKLDTVESVVQNCSDSATEIVKFAQPLFQKLATETEEAEQQFILINHNVESAKIYQSVTSNSSEKLKQDLTVIEDNIGAIASTSLGKCETNEEFCSIEPPIEAIEAHEITSPYSLKESAATTTPLILKIDEASSSSSEQNKSDVKYTTTEKFQKSSDSFDHQSEHLLRSEIVTVPLDDVMPQISDTIEPAESVTIHYTDKDFDLCHSTEVSEEHLIQYQKELLRTSINTSLTRSESYDLPSASEHESYVTAVEDFSDDNEALWESFESDNSDEFLNKPSKRRIVTAVSQQLNASDETAIITFGDRKTSTSADIKIEKKIGVAQKSGILEQGQLQIEETNTIMDEAQQITESLVKIESEQGHEETLSGNVMIFGFAGLNRLEDELLNSTTLQSIEQKEQSTESFIEGNVKRKNENCGSGEIMIFVGPTEKSIGEQELLEQDKVEESIKSEDNQTAEIDTTQTKPSQNLSGNVIIFGASQEKFADELVHVSKNLEKSSTEEEQAPLLISRNTVFAFSSEKFSDETVLHSENLETTNVEPEQQLNKIISLEENAETDGFLSRDIKIFGPTCKEFSNELQLEIKNFEAINREENKANETSSAKDDTKIVHPLTRNNMIFGSCENFSDEPVLEGKNLEITNLEHEQANVNITSENDAKITTALSRNVIIFASPSEKRSDEPMLESINLGITIAEHEQANGNIFPGKDAKIISPISGVIFGSSGEKCFDEPVHESDNLEITDIAHEKAKETSSENILKTAHCLSGNFTIFDSSREKFHDVKINSEREETISPETTKPIDSFQKETEEKVCLLDGNVITLGVSLEQFLEDESLPADNDNEKKLQKKEQLTEIIVRKDECTSALGGNTENIILCSSLEKSIESEVLSDLNKGSSDEKQKPSCIKKAEFDQAKATQSNVLLSLCDVPVNKEKMFEISHESSTTSGEQSIIAAIDTKDEKSFQKIKESKLSQNEEQNENINEKLKTLKYKAEIKQESKLSRKESESSIEENEEKLNIQEELTKITKESSNGEEKNADSIKTLNEEPRNEIKLKKESDIIKKEQDFQKEQKTDTENKKKEKNNKNQCVMKTQVENVDEGKLEDLTFPTEVDEKNIERVKSSQDEATQTHDLNKITNEPQDFPELYRSEEMELTLFIQKNLNQSQEKTDLVPEDEKTESDGFDKSLKQKKLFQKKENEKKSKITNELPSENQTEEENLMKQNTIKIETEEQKTYEDEIKTLHQKNVEPFEAKSKLETILENKSTERQDFEKVKTIIPKSFGEIPKSCENKEFISEQIKEISTQEPQTAIYEEESKLSHTSKHFKSINTEQVKSEKIIDEPIKLDENDEMQKEESVTIIIQKTKTIPKEEQNKEMTKEFSTSVTKNSEYIESKVLNEDAEKKVESKIKVETILENSTSDTCQKLEETLKALRYEAAIPKSSLITEELSEENFEKNETESDIPKNKKAEKINKQTEDEDQKNQTKKALQENNRNLFETEIIGRQLEEKIEEVQDVSELEKETLENLTIEKKTSEEEKTNESANEEMSEKKSPERVERKLSESQKIKKSISFEKKKHEECYENESTEREKSNKTFIQSAERGSEHVEKPFLSETIESVTDTSNILEKKPSEDEDKLNETVEEKPIMKRKLSKELTAEIKSKNFNSEKSKSPEKSEGKSKNVKEQSETQNKKTFEYLTTENENEKIKTPSADSKFPKDEEKTGAKTERTMNSKIRTSKDLTSEDESKTRTLKNQLLTSSEKILSNDKKKTSKIEKKLSKNDIEVEGFENKSEDVTLDTNKIKEKSLEKKMSKSKDDNKKQQIEESETLKKKQMKDRSTENKSKNEKKKISKSPEKKAEVLSDENKGEEKSVKKKFSTDEEVENFENKCRETILEENKINEKSSEKKMLKSEGNENQQKEESKTQKKPKKSDEMLSDENKVEEKSLKKKFSKNEEVESFENKCKEVILDKNQTKEKSPEKKMLKNEDNENQQREEPKIQKKSKSLEKKAEEMLSEENETKEESLEKKISKDEEKILLDKVEEFENPKKKLFQDRIEKKKSEPEMKKSKSPENESEIASKQESSRKLTAETETQLEKTKKLEGVEEKSEEVSSNLNNLEVKFSEEQEILKKNLSKDLFTESKREPEKIQKSKSSEKKSEEDKHEESITLKDKSPIISSEEKSEGMKTEELKASNKNSSEDMAAENKEAEEKSEQVALDESQIEENSYEKSTTSKKELFTNLIAESKIENKETKSKTPKKISDEEALEKSTEPKEEENLVEKSATLQKKQSKSLTTERITEIGQTKKSCSSEKTISSDKEKSEVNFSKKSSSIKQKKLKDLSVEREGSRSPTKKLSIKEAEQSKQNVKREDISSETKPAGNSEDKSAVDIVKETKEKELEQKQSKNKSKSTEIKRTNSKTQTSSTVEQVLEREMFENKSEENSQIKPHEKDTKLKKCGGLEDEKMENEPAKEIEIRTEVKSNVTLDEKTQKFIEEEKEFDKNKDLFALKKIESLKEIEKKGDEDNQVQKSEKNFKKSPSREIKSNKTDQEKLPAAQKKELEKSRIEPENEKVEKATAKELKLKTKITKSKYSPPETSLNDKSPEKSEKSKRKSMSKTARKSSEDSISEENQNMNPDSRKLEIKEKTERKDESEEILDKISFIKNKSDNKLPKKQPSVEKFNIRKSPKKEKSRSSDIDGSKDLLLLKSKKFFQLEKNVEKSGRDSAKESTRLKKSFSVDTKKILTEETEKIKIREERYRERIHANSSYYTEPFKLLTPSRSYPPDLHHPTNSNHLASFTHVKFFNGIDRHIHLTYLPVTRCKHNSPSRHQWEDGIINYDTTLSPKKQYLIQDKYPKMYTNEKERFHALSKFDYKQNDIDHHFTDYDRILGRTSCTFHSINKKSHFSEIELPHFHNSRYDSHHRSKGMEKMYNDYNNHELSLKYSNNFKPNNNSSFGYNVSQYRPFKTFDASRRHDLISHTYSDRNHRTGIPHHFCSSREIENILNKRLHDRNPRNHIYFLNIIPMHGSILHQDTNHIQGESRFTGWDILPTFKRLCVDDMVPIGATLALHAEVEGTPKPDVEWLREDQSLPKNLNRYRYIEDFGLHTLLITDVSYSEAGKYSCRAYNKYGTTNVITNVFVIRTNGIRGGKPPMFISRPETILSVNTGSDVSVSFRLSGDPRPKVIWMKGLTDITETHRTMKETINDYTRLILKRAQLSDSGTYFIIAKNEYGTDRAFFTLRVNQRSRSLTPIPTYKREFATIFESERSSHGHKVPDAIPSEPYVLDCGKNWLTLTWLKPKNCGGAPILAYRVECWLTGEDGGAKWIELGMTPSNTFEAFNLKTGKKYNFKVTPRNQYGWGEPVVTSSPILVKDFVTFPEFEKVLPGQLKALMGNSIELECKLKNENETQIEWHRDGILLENRDACKIIFENGRCLLHIDNLQENDSGRYVCEAFNKYGRICTFVRLMVVDDPKIVATHNRLNRIREGCDGKIDLTPQFTMRLRNRRIEMTYPVRLTCQVIGYPKPKVSWFKDGQSLHEDQHYSIYEETDSFQSLEICRSMPEHTGTYTITASNSSGAVSCKCDLLVDRGIRTYIEPKFIEKLDTVYSTVEDMQLRIKASVQAYPSVGITWQKNGIRLRPSRRIIVTLDYDGKTELTIANVKPQDSGIYTCTATNAIGSAETNTRIEVFSKHSKPSYSKPQITTELYSKEPKFLVKPRSCKAREGDHVIIECEIIGDPKPHVTWLRDRLKLEYYRDCDDFKLSSANSCYQLEIPRARFDHTGAYTVTASNEHGETKAVVSLQVYSKDLLADTETEVGMPNDIMKYSQVEKIPKIKKHLSDIKCCDGDSATFECEIHTEGDTSNVDFRWYKNGRLIPLGNDFEAIENGSVAKLIIKHVYPEDEGRYSCIASNNLGNATTTACLIVDVPEEKENLLSRQLNRPSGVSRSRGSTPLSITKIRSRTTSPVEDTSVHHHTGHRFRRKTAPKFYAVPHNKIAELGQTVRFQCALSGHPEPTTTWDKNDVPIISTTRISIQERDDLRILEISNVTFEDEGLYRIIVENEVGRCEATARLEIMNHRSRQTNGTRTHTSDGSFGRHAIGKVANVGGKCTISCNVPDASSATSTSWYKNGESLKTTQNITPFCDKTSARLQFDNLTTDNSGVYTCITENNSGLTRCSAELIVLDDYNNNNMDLQPPVFVTGLPARSSTVEGNPFEFKIKLQGELPMQITWYKNGEKLPNCGDFQYIDNENGDFGLKLNDVFLADSGTYKCEVYNCYGDATSAGQLAIQEEQPFFEMSPFTPKPTTPFIGHFTPAIVTEGPIDMIALRGDTVSLKITYVGDPMPSVRWMKAGRQLLTDDRISIKTENDSSILKIEQVTADDGGKYEICVENVQGNDTHTTSLAVEGSPDAPKGQPNSVAGDRCATVTWQSPPYDGGSIIIGYTIEMRSYLNSQWRKVENCHSLFCTIRGLIPGESYIFRIRAENKHGLSNPSQESIPTYITHADICSPIELKRVYIQNGETFNDHYEVQEELGKGRYGTVFKVRDKEFGNYYAAKFVRCIKSKDKEKVREEITIMNQLKHPKLLQLMAAYENVKDMIMVTEYISGGELFERVVADDFTLTERDCILFMRQICEGVAYIHKNNVVHLDLKPENIMCVSRISHQIKLIDFGLAQKISPDTPVRVLFGTPEFIPPEIINYEPIGTETDMWSVGVICYVLLSGLSPFMGENDAETFANITRADFDFDDEAFNAISDDAKDFISSLLVKRKEERLTAKQCLHHKWLAQYDKTMSCVKLCTDKLKKFIIRRKWQKTGNAIRALRRMAITIASRRNSNASSSSSSSPRVSLSGTYSSRMSSLEEDTPFVDNENCSKTEIISRHNSNELENCKTDDNCNIMKKSMTPDNPIDDLITTNTTNENQSCKQFKLGNPPKGLHKSVMFEETYISELPSLVNNGHTTKLRHGNDDSMENFHNGVNELQIDITSSSSNSNKFKQSTRNPKNNDSYSNASQVKLDNFMKSRNFSVVPSGDCTNISESINGKNNLLNKNLHSNKVSKFADTAKIKTSERLKMFEQLSTPACTTKAKKETFVNNKTNFQKAIAFWNRE